MNTINSRVRRLFPVSPGRFASGGLLLAVAVLWVATPGCDVQIGLDPDTGDPTIDDGNSEPESPVPDSGILLTVVNQTDAAVDAEIYVSTNSVDAAAEALFVDTNALTEGIGLAGRGVMQPDTTDSVELTCAEGLVLGTAGGSFLDPDTGELLGVGEPRIFQEGLVFTCGAEIALIFRVDADTGDFAVTIALE